MEVLIVSKTHMSNAACVGGLVLSNNRYIRLLNPGNYNQPKDTEFNVGDIYDITFSDRTNLHPPHIEDIIISSKRFVRRIESIDTFLLQRNVIDWNGHINNLFGNLLSWTNSGTGYIPMAGQMPTKSVGFWIADQDLIRATYENNRVRYRYPNGSNYRSISYVGYQDTLSIIPAGTIIRVSLSRIFPSENSNINTPRGFYLQLSGWYKNEQLVNLTTINQNSNRLVATSMQQATTRSGQPAAACIVTFNNGSVALVSKDEFNHLTPKFLNPDNSLKDTYHVITQDGQPWIIPKPNQRTNNINYNDDDLPF